MKTATAPLPPLRSVRFWTSCVSAYATCITVYEPNRLVNWVRAFIRFHGVRHPATLGSSEVEAFLSWLANGARFRSPRIVRHWPLLFFGKVLCTDLPPGFRRSEDLGRRGACRWC